MSNRSLMSDSSLLLVALFLFNCLYWPIRKSNLLRSYTIFGNKWAFSSSPPPSLRGSAWAAPCGRRRAKHDTPTEEGGLREHEVSEWKKEKSVPEKARGKEGGELTRVYLILSEALLFRPSARTMMWGRSRPCDIVATNRINI